MGRHQTTRLILIRHAQSEGNAANIVQGWTDSPLSELGQQQAQRLGAWLARNQITADFLFSSPLLRAYHTARAVGAALNLPIEQRDGLKEVYLGQMEDVPDPQFVDALLNVPNFETVYATESTPAFSERAIGTLHGLLARYHGHTLIVVTHLGVICTALAYWLERDVSRAWDVYGNIGNTGVTDLRFHVDDAVEVLRRGDLAHLADDFTA